MLERELESDARKAIERRGGKMLKWVSPGKKGVPDRIVFWPGGVIHFVEMKKPRKTPDVMQQIVHAELRVLGARVFVISTHAELTAYLAKHAPTA